jgi:hypothetical protein
LNRGITGTLNLYLAPCGRDAAGVIEDPLVLDSGDGLVRAAVHVLEIEQERPGLANIVLEVAA